MNPKPFEALNHFTVPRSFTYKTSMVRIALLHLFYHSRWVPGTRRSLFPVRQPTRKQKKTAKSVLAAPRTHHHANQAQQMQCKNTTGAPFCPRFGRAAVALLFP